jgi:hypothetical protein
VAIEYRLVEYQYNRLPALLTERVRRRERDHSGATAALSAKAATTTIPIVFLTGADPVKLGSVNCHEPNPGREVPSGLVLASLRGLARSVIAIVTGEAENKAVVFGPSVLRIQKGWCYDERGLQQKPHKPTANLATVSPARTLAAFKRWNGSF